jgi:tetratricopeptide (TPR) repeat protein
MKGIVVDKQTGEPIEGVSVKMYCERAGGLHADTPVTDGGGAWKAVFLRYGNWDLDFTKVGYQAVKISVNLSAQVGAKMPDLKTEMIKVEGPQLDEGVAKEIEKGQKLVSEGRIDEALAVFEGVIKQFKDSQGVAIVNMYIGNCHSAKEAYQKAIDAYKLALIQYPSNQELIISIGNAYNNLKQSDEAMIWFNKIAFEELTNLDTLYNIGTNFYNTQKYDLAVKYYGRATELSPAFAPAWYQLGMTYVAMGKETETVAALKKFMELDPESPDFETAREIVKSFEK